jgi:HD-GYP domain-containing protein (c-di-GMP phosphodiesterase class II)
MVHVRSSGRPVPVEVSFSVLRDGHGTVAGILGVSRDISERKASEQQLKLSLERLAATFDQTVLALASLVELRDPYTAGHQRRVSQLAVAIAKGLGESGDQVDGVRLAGLLHDVGKMQIPAEILSKPARLTEVERQLIRQHPQTG